MKDGKGCQKDFKRMSEKDIVHEEYQISKFEHYKNEQRKWIYRFILITFVCFRFKQLIHIKLKAMDVISPNKL